MLGIEHLSFDDIIGYFDHLTPWRKGSGLETNICCPAHGEENPSLTVTEKMGRLFFDCKAGCEFQDVANAIKEALGDGTTGQQVKAKAKRRRGKQIIIKPSPLRLEAFAEEKGFDKEWLKQQGVINEVGIDGVLYVQFTYRNEDGSEYTRHKMRYANKEFKYSGGGDSIIPYGLHRLPLARENKHLVIVEGESDTLTLQMHDIDVIGIAGANGARALEVVSSFEGIETIYVSSDKDAAATQFINRVKEQLDEKGWQGDLQVIIMPDGCKDPSDLYLRDKEHFVESFGLSISQSISYKEWKNNMTVQQKATVEQTVEGVTTANLITPSIPDDPLNIIFESPQEKHHNETVMKALELNQDKLNFFYRGENLCRVVILVDGKPKIETMSNATLRAMITNNFQFFKKKTTDEGVKTVSAKLGDNIVSNIMHSQDYWNYRTLNFASNAPAIRNDGTIISNSSYDEDSGIYFYFKNELCLNVPKNPTDDQIQHALRVIKEELFADVLFKDERAFANTLGFFLTPLLMIQLGEKITPVFLIDANKRSAGKTTLYEMCSVLAYGSKYKLTPFPSKEEEMEKLLVSTVSTDAPILAFDNVKRRIDSAALEGFVTSTAYGGRLLGTNTMVSAPKRTMVVITVNNARYSDDMATRFCRIELHAADSKPDKRDVRVADILEDIQEKRSYYLSALFTLIRAWIARKKPIPQDSSKTRFKSWSNTIAGILSIAGVPCFMEESEEEMSEEEYEWSAFLEAWYEYYPKGLTVSELLETNIVNLGFQDDRVGLGELFPYEISSKLAASPSLMGGFSKKILTQVGIVLKDKLNTPYGAENFKLTRTRDRKRGNVYSVRCDKPRPVVTIEKEGATTWI